MLEGLRGLRAQRAGRVSIRVPPRGTSREIAFPRPHQVYSARNKLAQTHEGMGASWGRIGVLWRGWGSGRVSE